MKAALSLARQRSALAPRAPVHKQEKSPARTAHERTSQPLVPGQRRRYQAPDPATGAIAPPIHVSSSFQYDAEIYQEVVAGARETVNIYGRCGIPGSGYRTSHVSRAPMRCWPRPRAWPR